MGRRRAVEGLVLDLTRISEGIAFTLEEVVVRPVPRRMPPPRVEGICADCDTGHMCRDISGELLCFLCRCLRTSSIEVAAYIRDAYKGPCSLCGRKSHVYHFDHINMFEKAACIPELACESIEVVGAEIAKCQLVCVPCHRVITSHEIRKGYFKKKRLLKKALAAGKDITEMRANYASEYARDFAEVYDGLLLDGS
jgi:hypothetical protein